MSKLVSVIIPIYKVERYVRKCIESVLAQTYADLEVILVDDGSPDDCPKICNEFEKADKRVKVVHKPNGGLVSARKAGLAHSHGDYVGYVDGDDWIEPDYYEGLVQAAETTGSDVVVAGYKEEVADSVTEICCNALSCGCYEGNALIPFRNAMVGYCDNGEFGMTTFLWNKLFRRQLLEPCQNAVPNSISVGEDAACVYPLLMKAQKVCVTDFALYHYRQRVDSMVKSRKGGYVSEKNLDILLDHLYKNVPHSGIYEPLAESINEFVGNLNRIRNLDLSRVEGIYKDAVLYGAGTFGQHTYATMSSKYLYPYRWLDPCALQYKKLGLDVDAPETVASMAGRKVVIAYASSLHVAKAKKRLVGLGVPEKMIISLLDICH